MFRDIAFAGYARLSGTGRRSSRRGTHRGLFIWTAMLISGAVGIDTNLTLVYQLFAILFSLIVFSRLSLRIQKPEITLIRQLPKYATAGQSFEYTILVGNHGKYVESGLALIDHPETILPTLEQFKATREPGEETRNAYDQWIGFHRFVWLQKLLTGIEIERAEIPELGIHASCSTRINALPLRRGIVNFTSMTLLCPDPLGLHYSCQEFAARDQLLILPKRYEMSHTFEIPGGRHFQPGGVNPTWSIGESDEFVSLREYRDGDPYRKIHWASSAKRDKPVVKEYQDEFFVRQSLVLDTDTDNPEVLEEVISVGASLLLQLEDSEGLMDLLYLSDSPRVITAGRGFAQTNHQLETLATMQKPSTTPDKLLEAVRNHTRLISGCLLVVPDWNNTRQDLYRCLVRASVPVSLFVITEEDEEPADLPAGAILLPLGKIAERLKKL